MLLNQLIKWKNEIKNKINEEEKEEFKEDFNKLLKKYKNVSKIKEMNLEKNYN